MTEHQVADHHLAELLDLGTATVYEASGEDSALDPALRPVWPGARACGRALPVRCHPADNLPLHLALEIAEAGDILVVDGRREACGYWGDVLALAAQQRGVTGLIIDGGVRDTAALRSMGFPVWSHSISVRRTGKFWPGRVSEPIDVGGVHVNRGDAVIADADGIVVLAPAAVGATLDAARRRVSAETSYQQRLIDGELTLDIMQLRH